MNFKNLLGPYPLYNDMGLGIVRIFTGIFMVYHGWEVFDEAKMNEYTKWMVDMKLFAPAFMAYLGKSIELICGIFIVLGLFTRIAAIPLAITMAFICFAIGKGRIFMEDQHPFLFVLLAFLFFFSGPGRWNMDKIFFSNQNKAIK
ncbi:MAG: DoxX family protein [Chitinophagaceae bacterium]|nr:DoxX family protein [Chitinophagaceae bacterium]